MNENTGRYSSDDTMDASKNIPPSPPLCKQSMMVDDLKMSLKQMSIHGGDDEEEDEDNNKCSLAKVSSGTCTSTFNSICPRCGQIVYPVEKIGPIKGLTYHRVCFKCIKCDRQLDLKTYFTNAVDLHDRQIYCQNHFPKSNVKGCVNADNLHIRGIMQAPKLSVSHRLNLPKPNVDGQCVGIVHAVQAQNLLHDTRDKCSGRHHFPALPKEVIEARREIAKYQLDLEEKQKREEDELLAKFMEERRVEEDKIERELSKVLQHSLRALKEKYDKDLRGGHLSEAQLTLRLEREKKELERTCTLKKSEKTRVLRKAMMERIQSQTAEMVTRQSEEMIELIKNKEQEILPEQYRPAQITVDSVVKDDGDDDVRKQLQGPPAPFPSRRRKYQFYTDVSVIEHVDAQAINVAQTEQSSYTELIEKLTHNLSSDLEKARAIFRWITVKDLNCINFSDSLKSDTPMALLRGIKHGTETYHTLFMRLCSYAGLHCVNIKGHSKSFGYEPGRHFDSEKFINTWNAVLIDDEWRFVQCNWGARHLVMCKDTRTGEAMVTATVKDQIEYEYDEHYFLTDPDEFIFEFFPFDARWQLLPDPLTLDQFEQLPFVRSLFFHYSLDFINQKQAIIRPADNRGTCDVKLKMPSVLKRELVLHCQLRQLIRLSECVTSSAETDRFGEYSLERFVFHTTVDDVISFNIHLPQVGHYYLEIFANLLKRNAKKKTPPASPFRQSYKLRCVCKYKICCSLLEHSMHPLPPCAHGEWGPEKAARHYGWSAVSHPSAIIETSFADLFILFEIPSSHDLKFHCRLHANDATGSFHLLDRRATRVFNMNDERNLVVFQINMPNDSPSAAAAQYGLDIYARPHETKENACSKYLINRNEWSSASDQTPLATRIGPNEKLMKSLGIHAISHPQPIIELASYKEDHVNVTFCVRHSIEFTFDIKHDGDTSGRRLSKNIFDIVKVKSTHESISFRVALETPGRFLFTIYVKSKKNNHDSLQQLYTYAILKPLAPVEHVAISS